MLPLCLEALVLASNRFGTEIAKSMTRVEWWGAFAATIRDDDMITSIHMLIYSDALNQK